MPLINLRTNLKTTSEYRSTDPNLTYGHDRRGGGSSDQPFIITDIPDGYENVAVSGPDLFLRNGTLNFTVNSKDDVLRLGKWFLGSFNGQQYKERVRQANENVSWSNIGSVYNFVRTLGGGLGRGLIFTAKQEALGRQETIIRTGQGQGLFAAGANKYYSPLNTILQAGVLSIGYHLNQKGLNPFDKSYFTAQDKANGYYGTTLTANGSVGTTVPNGGNARLSILFNAKQTSTDTLNVAQKTLYEGIYNGNLTDGNVLFSYSGGPGSFLGIGKTNIRIWNPLAFATYIKPSVNITNRADTILADNPKDYLVPNNATITSVYTTSFPGYGINGVNNTYKTSQTSFNRSRANSTNTPGTTYKLNPNLAISSDQDFIEGQDIIDFSFTLINNGGIDDGTTNRNTFINFRAYIDDFSDGYTGEWDAYRYMGRAENFYRYKGFTREMTISFTVPVLSRADMITIYQKLNALTWLTMPDYSDAGLMRGNLAYFTMGDYLRKSIIVVKSLNYTPIMEMGFDINRKINGDTIQLDDPEYTGQLPKGIRVNANIIPLTSETNKTFYTPQRGEAFIGNRTHAIVDRQAFVETYTYNGGLAFSATSSVQSPLMTLTK
jgi:hypothetical protein